MHLVRKALEQKFIAACLSGDCNTVVDVIKNEDKKLKNVKVLSDCFMSACEGGHANIIDILLQYRDITTLNNNMCMLNSIYCAANYGHMDVVMKLKELCDTDNRISDDHFWDRFLSGACKGGQFDLFRLKYDQNNHHINLNLNSYLSNACESGNMKLVNFIYELGNKVPNSDLESTMYWCLRRGCRSGNMDIINFCINHGACEWESIWDNCLVEACRCDNIELMEFMIEKGATNFDRCLGIACHKGYTKTIKFLLDKGVTNWDEGLIGACEGNDMDIVELMIEKGGNDWSYAMQSACKNGNIELAKFLMTKGVTLWDHSFQFICGHGDLDFAKTLLSECETIILHWGLSAACEEGHVHIVKFLLDLGVTVSDSHYHRKLLNRNMTDDADISNLLISKGVTDLSYLKNTNDFKLYCLYCGYAGIGPEDKNNRYFDLLLKYPPYVLFVGSACRSGRSDKNHTHKLPVELFRLLCRY